MNNKMIFLGIALIVLAIGVRAASLSGDFSLEVDCFNHDKAVYTLTNDTDVEHTYTITAEGPNADWINLNGKGIGSKALVVTLQPDQSIELFAFVKPQDCYIEPGNYTITIRVENDETLEKDITVIVVSTRELTLDVSPTQVSLPQCEEAEFDVEIENTGKSDEIVQLSVSGIPETWVEFSQSEFLLEKGFSKELSMTLEPACNAAVAEYDFEVTAAIKGIVFAVSEDISLEIEDAQETRITAPVLNACNDASTEAEIEIKNSGRLADGLELSLEGLDWVSLEQETISLDADETVEVGIVFAASGADEGSYEFSINAHSTKFNKDTVEDFTVTVGDCYNIFIDSATIDGRAVGAEETACIEENPTYVFTVSNAQGKAIDVDVSIEGMNASIKPASLSLAENESKTVEVEIDLGNETDGAKEFTLLLESQYFTAKQVYKLSVEDCYAIEADYDGLTEAIDLNANCEPFPVTVLLTNTGTKENSVTAEISGAEWVYVEPTAIDLQPGEEKGLFVYISPPYDVKEGEHTAELSLSAKDFADSQEVKVNVYGGLYAELGVARVSAESELKELLEEIDKTVEITLEITNDSNALLRVQDINVLDFYAEHSFEKTTLQPGESTTTTVKLYLGKGWVLEEFDVPIQFITDKGTITRDVHVDLTPEEDEEPIAQVGLFSLATAKDALLVAMVAIVIALIVMLALRASKPKPSTTMVSLAEQVHAEPGKKLEEIGKKKKRGRKKGKK